MKILLSIIFTRCSFMTFRLSCILESNIYFTFNYDFLYFFIWILINHYIIYQAIINYLHLFRIKFKIWPDSRGLNIINILKPYGFIKFQCFLFICCFYFSLIYINIIHNRFFRFCYKYLFKQWKTFKNR